MLQREHGYSHEFLTCSSAEYGQHEAIHCLLLNLHYKTTWATQCVVSERIARPPKKNVKSQMQAKSHFEICHTFHIVPSFNDWLAELNSGTNAGTPIPIRLPSQKKKIWENYANGGPIIEL